MAEPTIPTGPARRRTGPRLAALVALVALVVAMALDTTVVRIGSDQDVQEDVFSAAEYGAATFPDVQTAIETRAVDAPVLAAAIAEDKAAAGEQYGVPAGIGPVMAVRLEGIVGQGKSGVYDVAVEDVPDTLRIRVQMGPAINGTDLRDASGAISFGQFKNQIEYQDAGSAINETMKSSVLASLDREALSGKRVTLVGAFKLINPNSWLITPVRLSVE